MTKYNTIAFFDLETTGTNVDKDQIVQLCVVITDEKLNVIKPPLTCYVKPTIPISPGASKVHGITEEVVSRALPFSAIANDLYAYINDHNLGTFNGIKFDIPMLVKEFERCGIEFSIEDKLLVDGYVVFATKEPRNLQAAVTKYTDFILDEDAHDAEKDVLATIAVIRGQINHYPDIESIEDIHALTEPENRVDLDGKFKIIEGVPCYNFGPSFGEPVSSNLGLLSWMKTKDFSKDTLKWVDKFLNQNK